MRRVIRCLTLQTIEILVFGLIVVKHLINLNLNWLTKHTSKLYG